MGDSFLSRFLLITTGDKLLSASSAGGESRGAVDWEDNPNFSVNCETADSIFLNSWYDSFCPCPII
jgi:hypothetical protein